MLVTPQGILSLPTQGTYIFIGRERRKNKSATNKMHFDCNKKVNVGGPATYRRVGLSEEVMFDLRPHDKGEWPVQELGREKCSPPEEQPVRGP